LTVFFSLYMLANLGGGKDGITEIFKIATCGAATVLCALLIRSRADFAAGVIGLAIATGMMAVFGMQATADSATGVEALDVGNKNAFSLFVLPSVLLSGFLFFEMPAASRPIRLALKAICVANVTGCCLAIFLSGNRSGYVGCVLVGAMLLKEKKLYGMMLVGALAACIVYVMISFHMTDIFARRIDQTFVVKNKSDEMRSDILRACLKIGLEYPITGVSAGKLPIAIGNEIGAAHAGYNMIQAHNVFAHIWAGAGMLCFFTLGFVAWALFFMPKPQNRHDAPLMAEGVKAQRLVRMMVVLWIVRGMFTIEIVYNPGFSVGLGLAIGYCALMSSKPKQLPMSSAMPLAPAYAMQS
jgi:hypothetical protein